LLAYDVLFSFRSKAGGVGPATRSLYLRLSIGTILMWVTYPCIYLAHLYVVSFHQDVAILVFCIVDVLSKAMFGFLLLNDRDSIEEVTDGYSSIPPTDQNVIVI